LAAEIRAGDTLQFSTTVSGSEGVIPIGDPFAPKQAAILPVGLKGRVRSSQPDAATKRVIWSINGVPGGNQATGTITDKGLYNSPSILPSPNAVEVTARSVAEPSVSQTALLTLYNPIPAIASVTPSKVSEGAFTLTVIGRSFVDGAQ